MAAHNLQGSFSVSGEFASAAVSHSWFAVFADYFLSAVWARVRLQWAWVNSPPEKRLELALAASDEREVWEKRREGDKTSAAIAFINCSWELVQPWVVLRDFHSCPASMALQGGKLFGLQRRRVCDMKLDNFCAKMPCYLRWYWQLHFGLLAARRLQQLSCPSSSLCHFCTQENSTWIFQCSSPFKENLTEPQCRSQTFAWSSLTHRNIKRQKHRKHPHFTSKMTWPNTSL